MLELLHTRYHFENDGTGRKEAIARIRILTWADAAQWSELSFDYKPSKERVQILYVRILKKDGKVVSADTSREPRPRGVFRERASPGLDYAYQAVVMPPLSLGDTIEYDVETIVHTALTPGQFSEVYSFWPCDAVDEQLEIDIPVERTVKVKTKPGLETSVATENRRRIYRWNPPHQGFGCDANRDFTVRETPDVQISSFANWEEVGRWYAEMEKSRRVLSPAVRSKADELTQGLSTDLEKVAALYDFTAGKIKYFSTVSFGIGGYEPHTADEVLQTQYGDCKDKDALLGALLEAKGFHAASVLINPIRELDPDIPSPWPFTHVITMLQLGNDEIWMDASTGVLPFRMIPYPLRKKQALVIPPEGIPHFEETPIEPPMLSAWKEEIDGKVDENGALDATVSIRVRGDAEVALRQGFLNSVESARPAIVQTLIRGVNGQLSDVKISDPAMTREPFNLSFRISKPEFLPNKGNGSDLALPMPEFSLATVPAGVEETWLIGSRSGTPGEYTYQIKLELASRFTLQTPPALRLKREYGTYTARYELEDNLLQAERKLILNSREISSAVAEDYKAFREKVSADAEQKLMFIAK